MPKYMNLEVFIGQRYGKLTVQSIERINTRLLVNAICECGTLKRYTHSKLVNGHTKSCGCLHKQLLRNRMTVHGEHRSRLNNIWANMNDRCRREKNTKFKDYGGRGISVCDEWVGSFAKFREWALSNGYEDSLSIDRIDNNGNYCPDNCRWTTRVTQARNTRGNHIISYNGESKVISEWAEILNMNYNTLLNRINTFKWSIEKSFNTPVKS